MRNEVGSVAGGSSVVNAVIYVNQLFWGAIFVMATFYGLEQSIASAVLCLAIGIALLVCGVRRVQLYGLSKKYAAVIDGNRHTDITHIASATGSSPDKVKTNIDRMLKRKFLKGIYVDASSGAIVKQQNGAVPMTASVSTPGAQTPVKPQTIGDGSAPVSQAAVVCRSCGGTTNVPRGSSAPCEYCGNMLSA